MNNQKGQLIEYHWAYKADVAAGIEITPMLFAAADLPYEQAMEIGGILYEARQEAVRRFESGESLEGMTQDEYLDNEQKRLDAIAVEYNAHIYGGTSTVDMMTPIMVKAVCAISVLVAGGRLEQDEWNGDRFIHTGNSDGAVFWSY